MFLYDDVLRRFGPALLPRQVAELRTRIAAAHLRLLRFSMRDRRYPAAAAHIVRAFVQSPQRFLQGLGRQVVR